MVPRQNTPSSVPSPRGEEAACERGAGVTSAVSRLIRPALWGCAGGAVGALAGHAGVILLERRTSGANLWLKGLHGPPFFDLALSTALYFACLGGFLGRGRGRMAAIAAGFSAAFTPMAVPMSVATRAFAWGEKAADPPTLAWVYLVLGCYAGSNLAASAAVGACSRGSFSRKPAASRAAGGVAGAGAAFLVQTFLHRILPAMGNDVEVLGLWAPPSALYAGALWGAFIGAAAAWSGEKPRGAEG